ncbi:unnamed protein product [Ectocarpus sp. 12 AP-2014]
MSAHFQDTREMASSLEKQVHVEEQIRERCAEQWDYEHPVVNQQYCLMSIVDCENPQKPAAVKVFGCYASADAANAAAAKISSECDFFHVYVCPTNAWVPVPPSSEDVEHVEYQESRMKDIQEAFAALKERKAKDVIRHINKEAEPQPENAD